MSSDKQFTPDETTLILLATHQNWPNAISFEFFKSNLNPSDNVRIYSTPVMRSSAEALKNYILPVHDVHHAKGNSGTEFINFLKSFPADQHLTVNLTGGLKLFWRALPYLHRRPNTVLIYRELSDKQWYRITEDAEHEHEKLTCEERIDGREFKKLLQLQICQPHLQIEHNNDDELPQSEDEHLQTKIESILNLENRKHLKSTDFEKLVCYALSAFGMNTKLNIKVSNGTRVLVESDVFAWIGAKQLLIECKLVDEGSPTSMIDKLFSSARFLSGLNTLAILILPNYEIPCEMLDFAKAHGVEVWGPAECLTLFSKLYKSSGSTMEAHRQLAQRWDTIGLPHEANSTVDMRLQKSDLGRSKKTLLKYYEEGTIIAINHDGKRYLKCKTSKLVSDASYRPFSVPRIYTKRVDQKLPRALIFPWGIEVRSPHRLHLPGFNVQPKSGGSYLHTASVSTVESIVKSEGKDLKQWLEEKLFSSGTGQL